MDLKKLPNSILLLFSLCLLLIGVALIVWLAGNMPGTERSNDSTPIVEEPSETANPENGTATSESNTDPAVSVSSTVEATVEPFELTIGLAATVPSDMLFATRPLSYTSVITAYEPKSGTAVAPVALYFDLAADDAVTTYRYTFAAATRFDTIDPEISWADLRQLWSGMEAEETVTATDTETASDGTGPSDVRYQQIVVLTDTLPLLSTILGEPGSAVFGESTAAELVDSAWQETATLMLIPFDQLEPQLAVLAVDGQKPIENANKFDESSYPLVATVYGHSTLAEPAHQEALSKHLAHMPPGNRLADHLTVVAMTGVTAMVRLTAAEMDKRGYGWPAEVVGPELATADITTISNEVPFVPGCQTDTRMDNLTFCSKPEYMEALTASGVDIIGLTGNHQNDFGREDAVKSLDIYEEAGLPIYGGGRNKEEAFAPLYLEHNGNRLAFLGANSYGPQFAWATDTQPGSAEFDLNIMSATIRNIKDLGRAEVVFAELQYQESYDVVPLFDQRQNFNALSNAGADIVTGVQSHVPQAMEFTDGKLILYGLGNLYFDQMWSQSTREGLIVKHTIYNNRHISTQIFTTLLFDYGQPQWTTVEENRAILDRVFGASYW